MTRAVPVLMYHHVSPHPGLVTVSPETFEEHMVYLARKKYHALTADEFLEFLQGKRELSGRNVLITFDDGYLDNYVYAFPILQRYGLKATIFAITGLIGVGAARTVLGAAKVLPATPDHRACKAAVAEGRADEVILRWSEIEAMEASAAVEIHSHTHSHVRWDQLHADKAQRLAAVEADLIASRTALKRRLGKDSRHLCWPWGYFEPEYQPIAGKIGFAAEYATLRGVNVAGSDPRCIPRLVMKDRSVGWFATRVAIYQNAYLGRWYSRVRGD
jgi:peptidoglycan/xylan/chitin deacetylase (PgdA/CDA1 family)